MSTLVSAPFFSIYRKKSKGDKVTDEDLLQRGDQQVAAGYVIYGSSTMFVYTAGSGVHGFTLDPALGEFFLSHPDIKIPKQGSTYSINEGNTENWGEEQKNFIAHLKEKNHATVPIINRTQSRIKPEWGYYLGRV